MADLANTIQSLQEFTNGKKYNTIYADPPWQFQNRTGKVAPEHKRLTRYETMTITDIIPIIEACSQGPRIELFARGVREGWDMWGHQATEDYEPTWDTYSNHTVAHAK